MDKLIELADQAARDQIATDLETTFLVEAAAGTGKTTSLVSRMVALIRQNKTSISKIAAITFTHKAASHLRAKFQEELEKACLNEKDLDLKEHLSHELQNFERCFIGTIHSFCARLLRERPVEARVDPDFLEIDEQEESELNEAFWREGVRKLIARKDPVLQEIEAVGIRLQDLKSTYNTLVMYPDVEIAIQQPDTSGEILRGKVQQKLESAREALIRAITDPNLGMPEKEPEKGWDTLQKMIAEALRRKDYYQPGRLIQIAQYLEDFEKTIKVTQNRWLSTQAAISAEEGFRNLQASTIAPALQAWREYLYPIMIQAIQPMVLELKDYRKASGKLSFNDLLLQARDLLQANPEVRRYFTEPDSGRFTHILVDEFQDTDPIQAELMLTLTADDPSQANWQECRPRPGSLFVVGDPKQSIYRFRRADILVYNQVKAIIEQSGGKTLQLTTNFRSDGKICQWINSTFNTIFPEKSSDVQAAQVEIQPFRQVRNDLSGVLRLETRSESVKARLGVPRVNNPQIVAEDSRQIADWIKTALQQQLQIQDENGMLRPLRPSDILILHRGKKYLSEYARVLEEAGIPCQVTGGSFSGTPELDALFVFLQAVIDPEDALSLVSFLRGPLCGADDFSLYTLKSEQHRLNSRSDPPNNSSECVKQGFELIKKAREIIRTNPPAAALALICQQLGLIPFACSQPQGGTRGGDLLKLLSMARSYSINGDSFSTIIEKLKNCSSSEVSEMNLEFRQDAVQIMNLHKAKGLEAPIVFLACPVSQGKHPVSYHVDRKKAPSKGYYLISTPNGEHQIKIIAQPDDWATKAIIETSFKDAEEDRLKYVAATRAMNLLVISFYLLETKPEIQGPWSCFSQFVPDTLPDIEFKEQMETQMKKLSFDLKAAKEKQTRRYGEIKQEQYRILPITKLAHSGSGKLPPSEEAGRGMAYGRVLHGCLESLMRDNSTPLKTLIENMLREEELPLEETDLLIKQVKQVCNSSLWKRAIASPECYVEVPFSITTSRDELKIPDGPEQVILNGVIDLVFWDGENYTLIDYKTDLFKNRENELKAYYAPQVQIYCHYWQQLTGKPTRRQLLFINEDNLYAVPVE